jgi:L-asparaginase
MPDSLSQSHCTTPESRFENLRTIYNAVVLVCSPEASAWGVTVTMNQYVNAARHAVKDNITNVQNFDSGGYGYLGYVLGNEVIPYNTIMRT